MGVTTLPDEKVVTETVTSFWSVGGETFDLGDAVLVLHRVAPDQPLGNFVSRLRADEPDQIASVLTGADQIAGNRCSRVLIDPGTPPAAEAYLALHGWQPEDQLQLVLPESVAPPAPSRTLRPLADRDDDWSSIENLFRIDHLEEDERAGRPARPAAATSAAVLLRRSLTSQVSYSVVEQNDAVIACIAVWVSANGIGMVEDVFVHPDARGAGIATDMLRHAIRQARSSGAGPVLIGAEIDDTPKHLYANFGFRPAAVTRSYRRATA